MLRTIFIIRKKRFIRKFLASIRQIHHDDHPLLLGVRITRKVFTGLHGKRNVTNES